MGGKRRSSTKGRLKKWADFYSWDWKEGNQGWPTRGCAPECACTREKVQVIRSRKRAFSCLWAKCLSPFPPSSCVGCGGGGGGVSEKAWRKPGNKYLHSWKGSSSVMFPLLSVQSVGWGTSGAFKECGFFLFACDLWPFLLGSKQSWAPTRLFNCPPTHSWPLHRKRNE